MELIEKLAPYLPYRLKFKSDAFEETALLFRLTLKHDQQPMWITGLIQYKEDSQVIDVFPEGCVPILRPLSDLTKEIEHEGERFVPIIRLSKIIADIHNDDLDDKWEYSDGGRILVKTPWDLRIEMFYKAHSICWAVYDTWNHVEKRTHNQYLAFQQFFKWHFDVFQIIESGEAIDINTLDK